MSAITSNRSWALNGAAFAMSRLLSLACLLLARPARAAQVALDGARLDAPAAVPLRQGVVVGADERDGDRLFGIVGQDCGIGLGRAALAVALDVGQADEVAQLRRRAADAAAAHQPFRPLADPGVADGAAGDVVEGSVWHARILPFEAGVRAPTSLAAASPADQPLSWCIGHRA